MFLIIYFIILSFIMLAMIIDLKRNNQKLELKPIIIVIYIIQSIALVGTFNKLEIYNYLSGETIFEILGFCIFIEIAFVFILIQYLKFHKKDK